MKRIAVWVDGAVQGVGFRWWAQTLARDSGLTGTVANLGDGRVELHLQGDDAAVERVLAQVTGQAPNPRRPGFVRSFERSAEPIVPGEAIFDIV